MIILDQQTKDTLIKCQETRGVRLEGNILKVLDVSNDEKFANYVKACIDQDNDLRRKRLEITKQVQSQNEELKQWKAKNEQTNEELKTALASAETAKDIALNDLDLLQKKTQNQLIESIVNVSLWVICGVGLVTTIMFGISLILKIDNKIIESAWSNMFGILLTNSFSIIGTIMGVKYASERRSKNSEQCKCCKDCEE